MTRVSFNALGNANLAAAAMQNIAVNGFCQLSQENGDSSVARASTSGYAVDGWQTSGSTAYSTQRVTDAPPGIPYSVKYTITTAKASLAVSDWMGFSCAFEGLRLSRLQFGTTGALPLAVGFYFKSNITGTFYVGMSNSGSARSFNRKFVYSSANVWQFVPLWFPGDTSGTWPTDATLGGYIRITLASGTNYLNAGSVNAWYAGNMIGDTDQTNGAATVNNTFQVTGLVALPGTELPDTNMWTCLARQFEDEERLCQRYWYKAGTVSAPYFDTAVNGVFQQLIKYHPVKMRAVPGLSFADGVGTSGQVDYVGSGGGMLVRAAPYSTAVTDEYFAISAFNQGTARNSIIAFNTVLNARL